MPDRPPANDDPGTFSTVPSEPPDRELLLGGRRLAEVLGLVASAAAADPRAAAALGGGALLLEWVRERRAPKVRETLEQWERVLEERAASLDEDFLRRDEAVAFVEAVIQSGARLSEVQKRDMYAAALVNGLGGNWPDEDERYRMIDTLGRLRPAHLRLFAAARTNRGFDLSYGAIVNVATYDNGHLTTLIPDVPFEITRIDWGDLQRAGLVENEPVMGSSYSGYAKFVTAYGLRFDLFTQLPYDDIHPPRQ
jgi:hypothetical protein